MRSGIDWVAVASTDRFEKIVSVLLSTLHPDSHRVDGSGGDGGRDHQFYVDGRLELWQAKYFLGRLNSGGRKAQIQRSLKAAAAAKPDEWTLVTPMVPTPQERDWLAVQQKLYPFPLKWCGGDWLEARLVDHPGIIRHFMGPEEQYVALLREFQETRDVTVDGLPAGTERLEALSRAIDQANPFYRASITLQDGKVTNTTLVPKYPGAEKDSPVEISLSVSIGSTPADRDLERRIRDAWDWGEEAEIPDSNIQDFHVIAPHGFGQKEGAPTRTTIRIGPAEKEVVDLNLSMVAWSPQGRRLAMLPARLVQRYYGQRGVTIDGQDHSGALKTRLRADSVDQMIHLTMSLGVWPELLPGAMLPVLRFLECATAPNRLSFGLEGADFSEAVPFPSHPPQGLGELITFVEGLERLQTATAVTFAVPETFTAEELREVSRGVRLLDGDRVSLGARSVFFDMDADQAKSFTATFQEGKSFSVALDGKNTYVVDVGGHEMDLGAVTYYIQSMRPRTRKLKDGALKITLVPDKGYGLEAALGTLTEPPGQPPVSVVD